MNKEHFALGMLVILALILLALYISGKHTDKKIKIGIEKEDKELENFSINVTGIKEDSEKTKIIEFEIKRPVGFKLDVTAEDKVSNSVYSVKPLSDWTKSGIKTTTYEVRVYKGREVVVIAKATGKHVWKKEKNEIVET